MNTPIKLINIELDGRRLAFASNSEFHVQIGKGSKGSYRTLLKFQGDEFTRGFMYYRGINVGNGYKKRLVSWNMNKPIICKQTSY